MEEAKILQSGRNEMVCLPERFRFGASKVYIQNLGDAVILVPKDAAWKTFLEGLHEFSEDFLSSGREPERPSARETL